VKLSDMTPLDDVIEEHRKDNDFRESWDKSAFAREVAVRIVKYRTDNQLSQAQLANIVGLKQPAIARLEIGEQPPSLTTLAKLSATTGLEFRVEVSHGAVALAS
jgi:DNA-binding XRE family transcriptional regulator